MITLSSPKINELEYNEVIEVLKSKQLAQGPLTSKFETMYKDIFGYKETAAVNSGTSGLHVSLLGAGVQKGDKVLTTPFSFIATTNTILYCDAVPVFADIDPVTFNISPESIKEMLRIHSDIKYLLIVHMFGHPCDMTEIMKIVREHNLTLIEDCAHAHGATFHGKPVGSFGKAGVFSFYPTKNMTTGEGGMITSNDPIFIENCKVFINQGMGKKYQYKMLGYNYRMNDISASIGVIQLSRIKELNRKRIENGTFYQNNLNNSLVDLPFIRSNICHVFHQFTIKCSVRDKLIQYLQNNDIQCGIYYPEPLNEINHIKEVLYNHNLNTDLPNAKKISKTVLSIPVHPLLKNNEREKVVQVINEFN